MHFKLKGHRSVVNQCRWNDKFKILATSGVEKIIKIWSPFIMPNCSGGLLGLENEYAPKRKLYTYKDLFTLRTNNIDAINDPNDLALLNYVPVIRNRLNTEIDESTEEDKIMLAFFDSQVNRNYHKNTDSPKIKSVKKNENETVSSDNLSSPSSIFTPEGNSELSSDESLSEEEEDSLSDTESSNLKEKDREKFSSSPSSSSSSFTYSDEGSSNDINIDKLLNTTNFTQKKSTNSLRNRIRNLRHRRSLHIESHSDFKQVLSSLKVEESEQNTSLDNNQRLVTNDSHLEIEISNSSSKLTTLDENVSNLEILLPKTSNYSKQTVKNLNEHKRRIELNEDDLIMTEKNKIVKFTKDDSKLSEQQPIFRKKKAFHAKSNYSSTTNNDYRNYRAHNDTSPNRSASFTNNKETNNYVEKLPN